jgi:hypothetical protein
MRETQKIKLFRLLSSALGISSSKSSKRQQLRLGWFYFQVKLPQPLLQLLQKPFGILLELKAG